MGVERIRDPLLILILQGWSLTGMLDVCDVNGTVQFTYLFVVVVFFFSLFFLSASVHYCL